MSCCKKKECLLKLQIIKYINNDMSKETLEASELINLLTCDNLDDTKIKLQVIIETLINQYKTMKDIGTYC